MTEYRSRTTRPLTALFVLVTTMWTTIPLTFAADDDVLILPKTDWSVWPQGYSILMNEKVLFPHDVSFWRTKLDRSRQLFVDSYLIARASNLKREMHTAKKHPANPFMTNVSPYLITELPAGGYRVYFRWGNGKEWRDWSPQLWASESKDGIHWGEPIRCMNVAQEKPRDHRDRDPHLEISCEMHGLFYHPNEPDPRRRWKMILAERGHERSAQPILDRSVPAIALYSSPDGITWKWEEDTSLNGVPGSLENAGSNHGFPYGVGDVLITRWDPRLRKYIAHTKHTAGPDFRFPFRDTHQARVVGWCESDDLIHWSRPRIYAAPDGEDAKFPGMYGIYEANGFPYESLWLGQLSMTANIPHPEVAGAAPRHKGGYKRNWIRLTGSRDGRHWYYLGDRADFISIGDDTAWDAHYLRLVPGAMMSGPIVKGDELWFYYRAISSDVAGLPGLAVPKSRWLFGFGAATLRRDGFASLNAGETPGKLITRPFVFEGDGALFVNAKPSAPGGSVKVSVMEEEGEFIAGYELAHCQGLMRDSTKAPITWKKASTLAAAKGRYIRLVFEIQNAKLFSFWIE